MKQPLNIEPLVTGRHAALDVSKQESYSTVMSIEAVKLVFIQAKVNSTRVCTGDVSNDYLYSKTKKPLYYRWPQM